MKPLLLLRGLLAVNVLGFAFGSKRFRVDYGLHDGRVPPTKLAVPYGAKDCPSLRAEFAHPDVTIVFTCLCYYYEGLADNDLFLAFDRLVKSEGAAEEYAAWVKPLVDLPESFRRLIGVNLADRSQCIEEIFPHLRHSKAAIDFFLQRLVFPSQIREFPKKLSASGWDLGKEKPVDFPTTGFSGTNDSRHLLPLSVNHLDLDSQRHTNALVLYHLLLPENNVEMLPSISDQAQLSDAECLLQVVIDLSNPIQVILDVGAQILEFTNIQVAQAWLRMTEHQDDKKLAVVYCNEDDELTVLDRNGHIESFQTSHFSRALDLCYVFLDEAHTRGIDLKLPQHYRAAVTLGANLTKDRLMQGKDCIVRRL